MEENKEKKITVRIKLKTSRITILIFLFFFSSQKITRKSTVYQLQEAFLSAQHPCLTFYLSIKVKTNELVFFGPLRRIEFQLKWWMDGNKVEEANWIF